MQWHEKDFEEGLSKSIDKIYYEIFGTDINIHRIDRKNFQDDDRVLDKFLGIDTIITLSDLQQISIQEKNLKYEKQKWNALTLEYKNHQDKSYYGDWKHCIAQLYLFTYADKTNTEIEKYWLVDLFRLRMYLSKLGISYIEENYLRYNDPPNMANFFAIPFTDLEKHDGIIYKKS